MNRAYFAAAGALLICGLAAPVAAQQTTFTGQSLGDQRVDGIVVRFKEGTYELGLRDDRGNLDTVELHNRTIIFPIGADLTPGQRVSIVGRADGTSIVANEIDLEDPASPAWYSLWVAGPGKTFYNPPTPPVNGAPIR